MFSSWFSVSCSDMNDLANHLSLLLETLFKRSQMSLGPGLVQAYGGSQKAWTSTCWACDTECCICGPDANWVCDITEKNLRMSLVKWEVYLAKQRSRKRNTSQWTGDVSTWEVCQVLCVRHVYKAQVSLGVYKPSSLCMLFCFICHVNHLLWQTSSNCILCFQN
jgi:hypothetical protein